MISSTKEYCAAKMFHVDRDWEMYHRQKRDLVCYYSTKISRPRLETGRGLCLFHRKGTRSITSCARFYDNERYFRKEELWGLCEECLGASTYTSWKRQADPILGNGDVVHLIIAEQFFPLPRAVSWDEWTGRRDIPAEWPSFGEGDVSRLKCLAGVARWPWE